jgi:hypothetical protein
MTDVLPSALSAGISRTQTRFIGGNVETSRLVNSSGRAGRGEVDASCCGGCHVRLVSPIVSPRPCTWAVSSEIGAACHGSSLKFYIRFVQERRLHDISNRKSSVEPSTDPALNHSSSINLAAWDAQTEKRAIKLSVLVPSNSRTIFK